MRQAVLLLLTVIIAVQTEVSLDILETITIEEGKHISQSLVNLTDILIKKQRFQKGLRNHIKIYSSSDSELYPFTIQDENLLLLSSPADREAVCQSPPSKLLTKLCPSDLCCKLLAFQYKLDGEVETFFVLIKILDRNDNSPKFKTVKHPYIKIPENVKERFSIELPIAEDFDSPKYAVQRYSLVQEWPKTEMKDFMFMTGSETPLRPHLIVINQLDYERTKRYVFKLTAFDFLVGKSGNNGSVTIEIEIEDLNDNTPMFEVTSYNVEVKENEQMKNILHWKVVDGDSDRNGVVNVHIDNEEMGKLFHVMNVRNNEGVLGLVAPLDYENGIVNFKFNLVASDNGIPPRSSTAAVEVRLVNINDNGPRIRFKKLGQSESNTVQLKEGLPAHTLLVEVRVTDLDSPRIAISCRLEDSSGLFYLDQPSQYNPLLEYKPYNIKTLRIIDRESDHGSLIRVTVDCSDEDSVKPLTSRESLNIQIEDINDNSPVFSAHFYVATVEENQMHVKVNFTSEIIVADKDFGQNGKFEFRLDDFENSSDSESFRCDKIFLNIVTRRELDFEVQKRYKFMIIATDLGEPPLSGSATVTVNVLDKNDNAPIFSESQYSFSVSEDAEIGTKIGSVSAIDKDNEARNKLIIYTIEPRVVARDFILVDKHSGVIRTRKSLDHEIHQSFIFKITASNPTSLVNVHRRDPSSEAQVVIKVKDVNDNAPKFKLKNHRKPNIEFLLEQYVEGSTCSEIPYLVQDADDDDSTGVHCCTLSLENDYDKLFSLTTSTPPSICLISRPLKYQKLTITLIAQDCPSESQKSLSSKVSFTVLIRNDPDAKVGNNNRLTDTADRHSSTQESRNIVVIIILVTVILAFLMIIIIVIVIVRRSSLSDKEYNAGEDGVVVNNIDSNDVHESRNYLMSENSMIQSPHMCDQKTLLSPPYQGYMNTMSGRSQFNPNGPYPPHTYQHIMTNQGIRILTNPRLSTTNHYTYEWSPDVVAHRMVMPTSRSDITSSSDQLRSQTATPGEEGHHIEPSRDCEYQVLNPFGPRHQLTSYCPDGSQITKEDQSFTLVNNFFEEQVSDSPKRSNCQTMNRNYFQSTFV